MTDKTNRGETEGEIITLRTQEGEDIRFEAVARIAYSGEQYAILQPVVLFDGMGEDEALVFRVGVNEEGETKFELMLDDAILDAVFAEYDRLFDAEN